MGDILIKHKSALFAEFLGTFTLVLVGAGAVIMEAHTGMSHLGLANGKVGLVGIALAHGLTLTAMIYSLGHLSGGHFNPAVSLALWAQQKLKTDIFLGYTISQFLGAILAGIVLAGFFPDEISLANLGTPVLAAKVSIAKGMFFEGLITFLLVITVLFVTSKDNKQNAFAGMAIGMTLAGLILFTGPMTGGAANPARYLGPAIIAGHVGQAFPYLVGEFLGGLLAAFTFKLMQATSVVGVEAEMGTEQTATITSHAPLHTPATSESTSKQQVVEAYTLYRAGKHPEAVELLNSLFCNFNNCDAEVKKRILTLRSILEQELGKIKEFETFKHHTLANIQ